MGYRLHMDYRLRWDTDNIWDTDHIWDTDKCGIQITHKIQIKYRLVGWLVGCFGFNGPLRQYFSLYRAVAQREGERIDECKNVQTIPTAPI